MALTLLPEPPLATLAQGIATLWGVEATAFSPDGNLVLVKASYSDSAFPALAIRSAFWTYDLSSGQYGTCVNALIAADGRPIEVTDVEIAHFGNQTQLIASYQDTQAVGGFALNKLAIIRDGVLIQTDVVAQMTGNVADAQISALRMSADGRFLALETAATNLTADLDTNDCKDVYAFDLALSKVYRVSVVNAAEQYQDALLGDVLLGPDGTLSVGFQSVAAFAGNDANGAGDAFLWKLAGATSAAHGPADISLLSKTSAGAAGGENLLLSLNGTYFDSASGAFSSSDANDATDVWHDAGTGPALVSPGSAWLAQGSHLGSVSDGGRYVAVLTASPEIAGGAGVDQLLVVDTVAGGYQIVSQSLAGTLADDGVFAPILSADGTRIAFSSQATNLAAGISDGAMHLYMADLNAPADATAPDHAPQLGAAGNDVLTGTDYPDALLPGGGADLISAGGGDDILQLAADAVWVSGYASRNEGSPGIAGTGEEVAMTGKNRFADVSDGGLGADTVQLTDAADAFFLHDAYSLFNANAALANDAHQMRSAAREANVETIQAGAGDDLVDLSSLDYMISGVSIDGGTGKDILWGNAGNDKLFGGDGDDVLFGGAGNDILNGGPGADMFQFVKAGSGQDTIEDFTPGTDTIRLFGANSFAEVQMVVAADHVTVTWGDGNISLSGIVSTVDSADWFHLG